MYLSPGCNAPATGHLVALLGACVVALAPFGVCDASDAGKTQIHGHVQVVDGDTLVMFNRAETRVRLHGIDAPETRQLCENEIGEKYSCGQQATARLRKLLGIETNDRYAFSSAKVTCTGANTDRYGRLIAVCKTANTDINRYMVDQGLALAYRKYSEDYVQEENRARKNKRGIWKGKFTKPWEWRRHKHLR